MKMGKATLLYFFLSVMFISACTVKRTVSTDSKRVKEREHVVSGSIRERYSALLNVPQKDISNERLYRFIDEWMGTPYRFAGNDKSGVDCSGLTSMLVREVYGYDKLPRNSAEMAKAVESVRTSSLNEGDLIFFAFNGSKVINHVGIYLHNNKFFHASTTRGAIISDLKDPWYSNYVVKAGSLPSYRADLK